MSTIAARSGGLASQVLSFARHYLEMCIAMCVGGFVLLTAFFWTAGQLGQPTLKQEAPEFAVLATAVLFAVPMAGWMLFRGMEPRPTAEMAAATVAVAVALIALAWTGILPTGDLSGWASTRLCGPACIVMIPVMLARREVYSGHAGHRM